MPDVRSARRPRHVDLGRAPYFVTSRTFASRTIFQGTIGALAVEQLQAERDRYGFLLLAYTFMPDHAHFVIVPAEGHTISATMRVVKGGIARAINIETGAKGAVWQNGFYDRVARTTEQLNAYVEYTHRNPVAAGLVSRNEEYALSSADGRCMEDYQRFLNEPFVARTNRARAGKPTLLGETDGGSPAASRDFAPETETARERRDVDPRGNVDVAPRTSAARARKPALQAGGEDTSPAKDKPR